MIKFISCTDGNGQHQLTTPKVCRSSRTKVPTEIHQTLFSATTNKNGKNQSGNETKPRAELTEPTNPLHSTRKDTVSARK